MKYSDSRGGDYAIFSCRELPWASGLSMYGVGYGDPKSQLCISGNNRNLGDMPFLASVSSRGLPVCPCKESGISTQSSKTESPGNIRILRGLDYFYLPRASVIARGLPASPFKGVGYGNPKFQHRFPEKYSDSSGD